MAKFSVVAVLCIQLCILSVVVIYCKYLIVDWCEQARWTVKLSKLLHETLLVVNVRPEMVSFLINYRFFLCYSRVEQGMS